MSEKSIRLKLERFLFSEKSTIGILQHNGDVLCYTLEPSLLSKKLNNEGTYSATVAPTPSWSRFFGDRRYEYQIRLEDTDERKGILIHIGNTPKNTEGCILVGSTYGHDIVYGSEVCYSRLVEFLRGLAPCAQSDVVYFSLEVTQK